MQEPTTPYGWRFWYILFSLGCSVYAFFLNTALIETFQEQLIKEYFDFTRTIYYPQQIYLAESILFPWIGFLLGAGKHWLFYKLFCSFAIVAALPATAFFMMNYFNNAVKAWAFLLTFIATSKYFWGPYYIGMPDPLITVLLVALSVQRRPIPIFVCAVLATLTHFSITALSLFCIGLLLISNPKIERKFKIDYLKSAAIGLIVGRGLLALWYYRFKYDLSTRVDYVADLGLAHFIERYDANVYGFWLSPGWIFLFVFFVISIWAIHRKLYLFALCMYVSLAASYVSLFLTRDGLRVFALVMVGPYVFVLKTFIDDVFQSRRTQRSTSLPPTP